MSHRRGCCCGCADCTATAAPKVVRVVLATVSQCGAPNINGTYDITLTGCYTLVVVSGINLILQFIGSNTFAFDVSEVGGGHLPLFACSNGAMGGDCRAMLNGVTYNNFYTICGPGVGGYLGTATFTILS